MVGVNLSSLLAGVRRLCEHRDSSRWVLRKAEVMPDGGSVGHTAEGPVRRGFRRTGCRFILRNP